MKSGARSPKPRLGLSALVLFGLAYLAPMIVLGTFGVVAEVSRGATASSYVLALLAMMFTAASYGRMAALYPVAGSAYAYASAAINPYVGFLVGWAVTLDYLFLPMVIWLIGAAYLHTALPQIPVSALIVAFIVASTVLNTIGMGVTKSANALLMAFQGTVIAVFVLLAAVFVAKGGGAGRFDAAPFVNPWSGLGFVAAGAAIAAYSFLGFDAITTLSEEAEQPRRTIPIAIWLTALIGGAIFVLVAYLAQLAHPGFVFRDPASAASEIAEHIGGRYFTVIFVTGMVVAQFTSGLAAQAAGAHLIFAMARDGVLPRRWLGITHPRFRTPHGAVLLTGVVGLLALAMTVQTSTSFINFGAFTAFVAVNISVMATALRQRRRMSGRALIGWYILPLAGALIDAWLLSQLDHAAIKLGLAWLALGLGVLLYLTRGFRRPMKESGQGREGSRYGLDDHLENENIKPGGLS